MLSIIEGKELGGVAQGRAASIMAQYKINAEHHFPFLPFSLMGKIPFLFLLVNANWY